MKISLREVNKDNWLECINLQLEQDQLDFLSSNLYSLAEAKIFPYLVPLAIYDEDTMVGFLMYGHDPQDTDGVYWLLRFMIDKRHQGKGYGKASLAEILSTLRAIPDCRIVRLSFMPNNHVAERLYENFGFRKTGEMFEDELVADLYIS